MSTGIPSNTHKQYGDTGFPSNVPPLPAGWALRAEEEKHGKDFPAFPVIATTGGYPHPQTFAVIEITGKYRFFFTVANNPASFMM